MVSKVNICSLLICIMLLIGACSPTPKGRDTLPTSEPDQPVSNQQPQPKGGEQTPEWLPRPGDEILSRGTVYLDEVTILTMESYPLQFSLYLNGSLPTPCHQLRVDVSEVDSKGNVNIEVYSLTRPADICVQVLQPFEVNIPLPQPSGAPFKIWVNGEEVGEIHQ